MNLGARIRKLEADLGAEAEIGWAEFVVYVEGRRRGRARDREFEARFERSRAGQLLAATVDQARQREGSRKPD
jgi:hypothetical protein